MSFFGMKRRGLRLVVERGDIVNGRVALKLECGHTVTRDARESAMAQRATCRDCAKVDGAKADELRRRRLAS
jgi:hypothetical protein